MRFEVVFAIANRQKGLTHSVVLGVVVLCWGDIFECASQCLQHNGLLNDESLLVSIRFALNRATYGHIMSAPSALNLPEVEKVPVKFR